MISASLFFLLTTSSDSRKADSTAYSSKALRTHFTEERSSPPLVNFRLSSGSGIRLTVTNIFVKGLLLSSAVSLAGWPPSRPLGPRPAKARPSLLQATRRCASVGRASGRPALAVMRPIRELVDRSFLALAALLFAGVATTACTACTPPGPEDPGSSGRSGGEPAKDERTRKELEPPPADRMIREALGVDLSALSETQR